MSRIGIAAAGLALAFGGMLIGVSPAAAAAPPTTPPPAPHPIAAAGPIPAPHAGTGRATAGHTAVRPTAARTASAPARARACATQPPPAVDASEAPRPGQVAPAALPVPATPVGGPRMGECGDVLAPGAPPLPAGLSGTGSPASFVLADLDSGTVLAARDPHSRQRPASTLKVLTALVTLRKLDLDATVLGTQADADAVGSRVGVGPGGRYTVRQLLTGLLLNSGNDAANALARQLGGVPATLAAMSQTAHDLGALDTRPATPSGLDGPGMATSAYDLASIFRVAMREPEFATIVRTRQVAWPGFGDKPGFTVTADNKMLTSYPGTIGGKTGFTDDARHTFIVAAQRDGRRLVAVLMRTEQRPVPMTTQAARLLDYGFALPRDTEGVGILVDRRPADAPSEADIAAAATAPAAPAEADRGNRLAGLLTIGGGAVLGAALSVLLARRRPPRRGRHLPHAD